MSIFTTDKSDPSDAYYQSLKEMTIFEGEKELAKVRGIIEEDGKVMLANNNSSSKIGLIIASVFVVGALGFAVFKIMKKKK